MEKQTSQTKTGQTDSTQTVTLFNCPMHGEVEVKLITYDISGVEKTIEGTCPECQAEDKERDISIDRKMRQDKVNSRLDNAMLAPRFKDKTFDNYKAESVEQKEVLKDCKWFIDNFDRSMGLIFIGAPGTGKNHLASSIVKEVVVKLGKTALMTELRKIDRDIKESWNREGDSESKVIKRYSEVDLLVVDEVGVQRGTDTEALHLTEIINDRYNAYKPTIVMGNVTVADLRELIGKRSVERFKEGGRVVTFNWKSYRGRV